MAPARRRAQRAEHAAEPVRGAPAAQEPRRGARDAAARAVGRLRAALGVRGPGAPAAPRAGGRARAPAALPSRRIFSGGARFAPKRAPCQQPPRRPLELLDCGSMWLVITCLGSQGAAKSGLDRYGDAPRVGGELGHLAKILAPDPAASAVALHVAHAGSAASTRAGAEAADGSPKCNLASLNQLVRRCLLPRPRGSGAAPAEAGGGAPLERVLDTLAVRPAPEWPAAACDCLCRVSPDGSSSSSGSFTSGAGACAGLERARSGGSSASGYDARPCVPLEHARSAPSTLQRGRWAAALRRAHLDRAPSGSGTLDRASGSWRATPHDERGRRVWGRKRRASAPGERIHGDFYPLQESGLARRSRSDGAWLAAPPPGAPQRTGTALVGGTAEADCTVSAAGAAGGEPRPGLGRAGHGGQGFATPSSSPGGAPAPLDGLGCQSWGSGLVGWQSPLNWRAASPCPGVGSPTPGQSAADVSRWPTGPGSTHVLPPADQWPLLQRAGGAELELWPVPCGGREAGAGLEAGFLGAAREAPALVDAAVRLYGLGAAGAFWSAGAAAATAAAARAELARAQESLQVREGMRCTCSGRGAAFLEVSLGASHAAGYRV